MTALSIKTMQTSVRDRLVRLRRRVRRQLILEGLAKSLLFAFAVVVTTFLIDWQLDLSRGTRTVIATCAVVMLLTVVVRSIIIPAVTKWTIFDLAGALDQRGLTTIHAAIAPKVASLFEFADAEGKAHPPALAHAAALRSFELLQQIPFEQRLNRHRRKRSLFAVGLGVLLPIAFLVIVPSPLISTWCERWLLSRDTAWPRNTQIVLSGAQNGKILVPMGEPKELMFSVTDKRNRRIDDLRIELRFADGTSERHTLVSETPDSTTETRFVHEINGLREPATLIAWTGDGRLPPTTIVPVERPVFSEIRLIHRHAWDARDQIHDFVKGDGAISLLPATSAQLIVRANRPIDSLECQSKGADLTWSRVDESTFSTSWTHSKDVDLKLQLIGQEAHLTSLERSISIGTIRDRTPTLTLRAEGVRRRITPNAVIPLRAVARDDFGVASLALQILFERQNPSKQETADTDGRSEKPAPEIQTFSLFGPVHPAELRLVEETFEIDLREENLVPGDVVRVQGTATDDCFQGPQTATSAWIGFEIVKPEELFREILVRQQQLRSRLRKTSESADDLRDELTIGRIPDDVPSMIKDHRRHERDVATIHRALDASVREMELNRLGGQEAIELIRQNVLQKLDELRRHEMAAQSKALAQLARSDKDRDAVIRRQQQIVQTMKQILKNMAQWDSFVDVVNQLDAVIKLQEKLKSNTEQIQEKDVESVFDD